MAVSADEVKKLANLARIALDDAEVAKLQGELDSIVAYIDEVQKVPMPEGVSVSPHLDIQNVMRDDVDPHEADAFTEAMLRQAPKREGDFLKVKKILGDK